jgi:hypothetical protein
MEVAFGFVGLIAIIVIIVVFAGANAAEKGKRSDKISGVLFYALFRLAMPILISVLVLAGIALFFSMGIFFS